MSSQKKLDNPLAGLNLFQGVDIVIWILVFAFFGSSAVVSGGDLLLALVGAAWIVVVMFVVGISVEVLIESIRDIRGLGTVVGFITNGPEALCLIVGLIDGNILYAASTPLGSNVMNPLMLLAASLITRSLVQTAVTSPGYTIHCIVITASLAVAIFFIEPMLYLPWVIISVIVSIFLFVKRPAEPGHEQEEELHCSRKWVLPAIIVLVIAGYFLDPAVSFAAEYSKAPKGRIGFFVLAALTSWPEFKSTLSLLQRRNHLAAILNITVSNITNIWLAAVGVVFYLIFG